jgi:transposase
MFVRVTRTKNSPRSSLKVVESVREGHKVKQRMLYHVGIANDESEEEKLKILGYDFIAKYERKEEENKGIIPLFELDEAKHLAAIAAKAETRKGRRAQATLDDIIPVNEVTLDQVEEIARVTEGVHEVAGHVYDQLGYDSILIKKHDQALLRDLVLTRLAQPVSKHKSRAILEEDFGKKYDLDRIYRLMDKLHPQISIIKQNTFNKTRSLMPDKVDIVFFDVTTLYFESVETDNLREFGYSKDCRFNTTQLVLALATNCDGLPIGYELFSGNTAEVKTLLASLESWKKSFDIKSVCFVADRAMMSEDNLSKLEEQGYSYVIAAKLRSFPKALKEEILEEANYKANIIEEDLAWVGEFKSNERRVIVSYSTKRARHDCAKRDKALEKIKKRIGDKGDTKKLISNSAVTKYTTTSNAETVVDETKIDKDSEWDGLHGVITNIADLTQAAILQRYRRLWVIEESFRLNKHTLSMRPIYHFKQERIESHIAICYMAFALLRHLQYRVKISQKLSVDVIIKELLKVQSSILQHKQTGDLYRMPGVFSNDARKIYKTFNLTRKMDAESVEKTK